MEWSSRKLQVEVHPIDMLVDLVVSSEMDPWEIDIADIANRFLEEVRGMAKINLRLSGKTLLTSSILLRMKSESLMPEERQEEDEVEFTDYEDYIKVQEIEPLPVPMRRRAERKTTLFELVGALQRALGEEIIRKNFPRQGRVQRKIVIQVEEEDIKVKIASLYDRIKELAGVDEAVKFSELIVERTRRGIVELFLFLLYLDSQRKITVWQEELFGEIFITIEGGAAK